MHSKKINPIIWVILGLFILFLTIYIISELTYHDVVIPNPPIPVVEPIWKIQEKDGFSTINLSSAS